MTRNYPCSVRCGTVKGFSPGVIMCVITDNADQDAAPTDCLRSAPHECGLSPNRPQATSAEITADPGRVGNASVIAPEW